MWWTEESLILEPRVRSRKRARALARDMRPRRAASVLLIGLAVVAAYAAALALYGGDAWRISPASSVDVPPSAKAESQERGVVVAANASSMVLGSLRVVKLLKLPARPSLATELWCSKQTNPVLGPTIRRSMDRFPPRSAIVMLGDSTMRSVFDFIAHCMVMRDALRYDFGGNGTDTAFFVRDPVRQVQYIYSQNYLGHRPYSDARNRVLYKMDHVFAKALIPGFAFHAVFLNLAALHTLHRFPLHAVGAYDPKGWTRIDSGWLLEEVQHASAYFPLVLLLSPNALCSRRFDEVARFKWAVALGPQPKPRVVQDCVAVCSCRLLTLTRALGRMARPSSQRIASTAPASRAVPPGWRKGLSKQRKRFPAT